MKKLLLSCALLAAAFLGASADTTVTDEVFIKDGIMYHVLADHTLEVVNGTGVSYEGDLVIPSHVAYGSEYLPVTRIGYRAFFQNKNIRTVTFPNTLTYIDQAFIGSGLRRVSIPASVDTVAYQCFMECESLKEYILEDSPRPVYMNLNEHMDSLNYIYKGRDVLLMGPEEWSPFNSKPSLEKLDISEYVTKITNGEFKSCPKLKKIKLSNSVKVVEHDAFYQCYGVEEIDLGNSIDSIAVRGLCLSDAQKNSIPKKLILPASLRQVDWLGLTVGSVDTIIIKSSDKPLRLAAASIRDLDSLKYVELNRDLYDGFNSFAANSKKLSRVVIGEGVTRIPKQAFQITSSVKPVPLDYISFPSTLRVIGDYAFEGSPLFKDLIIPASIDSIGYRAFSELRIESLSFESASIEALDPESFKSCRRLKTVDLSASKLKSIDPKTFEYCDSIETLIFNNGFDVIPDKLFQNNYKRLENVTFSESLDSIGASAFSWCNNLKNVKLPASVRSIGANAFYNCKNAFENNTINFQENIEYLGYTPFTNVKRVTFCSEKPLTVSKNQSSFDYLDYLVLPLNCNYYNFRLNQNGEAYCLLPEPTLDLNLTASRTPAYLHVPAGSAEKYKAKYTLSNITIVDDLVAEEPRGEAADGQLTVTVECQPFAVGGELTLYADAEKTVEVGRAEAWTESASRAVNMLTFRFDGLTTYNELHYRLSSLDEEGVKIGMTTGSIKVNTPAAIDGIEADGVETADGAVYDLQGRRLNERQRGAVNIIGGRKVLVK